MEWMPVDKDNLPEGYVFAGCFDESKHNCVIKLYSELDSPENSDYVYMKDEEGTPFFATHYIDVNKIDSPAQLSGTESKLTKEEFVQRKKFILNEINKWNKELRSLNKHYIEDNAQFLPGSKVVITTPEHTVSYIRSGCREQVPEKKRFAYVVGNEINHKDEIRPILMKAKKDGEISKNRDYHSEGFEKIELA